MAEKIHIFYRHYSTEDNTLLSNNSLAIKKSQRPDWFNYETCFVNLINTIKKHDNVELHVVMDTSTDYSNNFIYKYRNYYTLEQFSSRGNNDINGIKTLGLRSSDLISLLHTYNYIEKLNHIKKYDLIYILENDFLHLDGWVDKVFDLYNEYPEIAESNYVTTYYNPREHTHRWLTDEHYAKPVNLNSKKIDKFVADDIIEIQKSSNINLYTGRRRCSSSSPTIGKEHFWKSVLGTIGTCIMTKDIFSQDLEICRKKEALTDYKKWFYLARNKNRIILEPVPTLSTHCMKNVAMLSPGVNWEALSNECRY